MTFTSSISKATTAICLLGAGITGLAITATAQESQDNTENVAPLIRKHCIRCHDSGRAAPFRLSSFQDLKEHAEAIQRVLEEKTMPPWLPAEGFGKFVHTALKEGERDAIVSWVTSGSEPGSEAKLEISEMDPDLTTTITTSYALDPTSSKQYRSFVLPLDLKEQKQLKSLVLQSANADGVVRQVIVAHDRTGMGRALDGFDVEPGFTSLEGGIASGEPVLAGFPGALHFSSNASGEATGWIVGPTSELIVTLLLDSGHQDAMVHLELQLALHFESDLPVPAAAITTTLHLSTSDIAIPAGAVEHVVTKQVTAPFDITALDIYPRANARCVAIKVFATLPDDSPLPLLSIDKWQMGIQETYRFESPIPLPKGSKIQAHFTYNNAKTPTKEIGWGPGADDEVAELWMTVVPDDPSNLPALRKASIELELQALVDGYQERLKKDSMDYLANSRLAHILVGQNKTKEALPLLAAALQSNPGSVTILQNIGLAQFSKNDFEAAGESFSEALEIDPALAPSKKGLASVLALTGKLDQAAEQFSQYLQLKPNDYEVRNNYGVVLANLNRLEESEKEYRLALESAGTESGVHGNLAAVLVKQQRSNEAIAFLQISIPEVPASAALQLRLQLAKLHAQQRDLKAAKALLEQVIAVDPNNADAMAGLKALDSVE